MSQVGKLMDFQLGGGNRVSQIGISHASAATSVTKKSTLYGIGKNFNSALSKCCHFFSLTYGCFA